MQTEAMMNTAGQSSLASAAAAVTPPPVVPETNTKPAEVDASGNDLASQFASLTKREKQFLKEKREFEEARKSLSGLDKIKEAIDKKSENPLAVLEAAGISLDEILDYQLKNHVAKDPNVEKMTTLEEKIKLLEGKLTEKEESEKQANVSKEIDSFKGHIKSAIDQDQERFGLVALTDSYDVVFRSVQNVVSQAIKQAQEDGEEIPYRTRAEVEAIIPQVAEQIENQIFEALKKIQNLGKVKSLFGSTEQQKTEANQAVSQAAKAIQAPEVTLTNSSSVPATGTGTAPKTLLDRDESIRLAAAKLKAAWNKP